MTKIQDFRDFEVYKRSYNAAIEMYRITRSFPKEELYGLISQIKRASTSVPLNIAEGYGKRATPNDFKRFLLMAMGSCNEMRVLLDISEDLGFVRRDFHEKYEREYDELGRMLAVLRERWK